ncbi:SWI/SNF-related matrix-associated actin-dependent regulator of chromatin subfamily A containing DEAD/H box 1 homolog [Episyrphus balteatus]|uniref:SWI/SNF-related matrix-associated actin-dependent regulator of chromatin subfamily A containing DEAD/H box 1 homolog n=1 Tax=Episyrphus balteatus TaxID=286459 RepID=UPI0024863813|nr:SWI/SNF-related matrix-associated actin-dependent regulator of chromatin subfamily A containing DEAD/H box 1 homolog [Episyrphus balteatus]
MSQSSPISKTTINDLRQFRLQKAASITERIPGKKRIAVLPDSDDSGTETAADNVAKKTKIELTILDKEQRFAAAAKISPQYDTMDIQDSLVRNNWDVSKSVSYLKEHAKPKALGAVKLGPSNSHSSSSTATSGGSSTTNGSSRGHRPPKSRRHSRSSDDDDEDSRDGYKKQQNALVYDSDESDTESKNKMTKQRQAVLDFFNKAGSSELLTVKTCSDRKVAAILEVRPFTSWGDLRRKVQSHKVLNGELLNYCQELINKQNNVAELLSKCKKLVKKLEAAVEAGAGITEQPKLLNKDFKLADYQIIGLNWLTVMHNQKMNGILADEMGLGKTIQVIAFLAYLKENNLQRGAHLVVVPSSTLDNWETEIHKWCPSLVVEKYYGNQDDRRRMRIRYAKEGFKGFDILLTTYHLVSSTPEEKKMFRVCKLHYVVFDEAHMLKNMTTARYANLITINAEMRILLTGTPLQNNLLELMSLLCFVMPSFFAKKIDDIKTLFVKKVKKETEDASQFNDNQVDRAKRIMKPFVLRRLKKDVLKCLPKKHDYIHKVPMTATQKEHYKELVEYYTNQRGEITSSEIAGVSIMMDMRKAANHPLLMRHYFSDERLRFFSKQLALTASYKKQNEQYIFEELAVLSDFQVWQICDKHGLDDVTIPNSLILDSGKFNHLDKLLPKLKEENHRVLIFSQFTMVLDIVERYLEIRGHEYLRLDGSTAVEERQDMIDDFNKDSQIFVFLLSTKAGGVGINLTAADTAIIHDIDFNPYNDKQAEDRCHRMGQTRDVSVYRLISEGTIEEGMLVVAQEKLKLEQDINAEGENDVQEQKCMVRLLQMALGLNDSEKET